MFDRLLEKVLDGYPFSCDAKAQSHGISGKLECTVQDKAIINFITLMETKLFFRYVS